MAALFPTLFSKTFFVLSIQLLLTWLSAHVTLIKLRQLHAKNFPWITSTANEASQIDLHIDWQDIKGFFRTILIANIVAFLALLFWGQHQTLPLALAIFGIWSVLTGIEMAICLISVDENLGTKVLAITATIIFATFVVGVYSKIDFGFMGTFLFIALLVLILFNLMRLFVAIPRAAQRWVAGIGVVIFTLYLVFDFNHLAKLQAAGMNDWRIAINIAIDVYLDIINLFLDLLDAMSK